MEEMVSPRGDGAELLQDYSGSGRDVAMIVPYYGLQSQWRISDYYRMLDLAEATGGSCRWYTAENATIDAITRSLEECCFVNISTHGGPGSLPEGVAAGVRTYAVSSAEYEGSYASLYGTPKTPGLYEAALQLGLKTGGSRTQQVSILVTKAEAISSNQYLNLTAGALQSKALSLPAGKTCYSAQLYAGEAPSGMILRKGSDGTLTLSGTPMAGHGRIIQGPITVTPGAAQSEAPPSEASIAGHEDG